MVTSLVIDPQLGMWAELLVSEFSRGDRFPRCQLCHQRSQEGEGLVKKDDCECPSSRVIVLKL